LTDAGFNILLSMETYKWYYHLISAERAGERHNFPYKLAGPLCDGGDVYFDIEGERRLARLSSSARIGKTERSFGVIKLRRVFRRADVSIQRTLFARDSFNQGKRRRRVNQKAR
jgi:hypothetical protein